SRWYCRNRWESRSVPFFTRKPLLETVKGFFRLQRYMLRGCIPDAEMIGLAVLPADYSDPNLYVMPQSGFKQPISVLVEIVYLYWPKPRRRFKK
ncbi:hypothetical protein, partial [Sphingobacterium thalpophilum]